MPIFYDDLDPADHQAEVIERMLLTGSLENLKKATLNSPVPLDAALAAFDARSFVGIVGNQIRLIVENSKSTDEDVKMLVATGSANTPVNTKRAVAYERDVRDTLIVLKIIYSRLSSAKPEVVKEWANEVSQSQGRTGLTPDDVGKLLTIVKGVVSAFVPGKINDDRPTAAIDASASVPVATLAVAVDNP